MVHHRTIEYHILRIRAYRGLDASLLESGLEHGSQEVVSGAVLQCTPLGAADGGPQRTDDDHIIQAAASAFIG